MANMDGRDLSLDLIEEIFSRVPAKSIARFRSTSKQWNALLKSVSFAKKHSANAPKEESLFIMLMDSRVFILKVNLHGIYDGCDPSAKVGHQFNLKDPRSSEVDSQVDIRNVFHCDGLFLCTTMDNRLVVWNPCLGETNWIKPRESYKKTDCYALGYDNDRSYKILRVDRQYSVLTTKNEYEVYDLTSNSWRVLGVATDWVLPKHFRGICVNGNAFWVAARRSFGYFLQSFDFSTEMFQSQSFPHPFPFGNPSLSVVGEEQLCLLGTNSSPYGRSDNFKVWVATSVGTGLSWRNSIAASNRKSKYKSYYVYNFFQGMSFLADELNNVIVYLSLDNILRIVGNNYHTQVENLGGGSIQSCSVLMNYVPSLAQISNKVNSLPGGSEREAPSTST
ncbi:unnamed protein product [Microthlaspi erraticum]|uniref:F-box domain-containing protein n=1 Tax=Microthlaspi erraticum TaxID=1685480 RepID=A0A6D2HDZ7_9BRAS|nr:unnamed protein product [Microthlaspi erraticum]